MADIDLTKDDALRSVLEKMVPSSGTDNWVAGIADLISYVRGADSEERRSLEFHERIWDENPVSAVGMGTVNIRAAIEDPEFRDWVASQLEEPLPDNPDMRLSRLQKIYQGLEDQLRNRCSRVAIMKVFRVLAAFYPRYFTTITYWRMALECHRALFGKGVKRPDKVECHLEIMSRLNELLGVASDDPHSLAERMILPWLVFEKHVQSTSNDAVAEEASGPGEIRLKPLPAIQRRKGFTSIKGGLNAIAGAISFVSDGVTREELFDFLRGENPDHRDSSIRTLISILKNEFYAIKEEGGVITPTTRGELFLETSDPQELIPLFLTRTLGVDHLLCALEQGPKPVADLLQLLRRVNPGWTTDFAPRAMLKWLREFSLLEDLHNGSYELSAIGREWAAQIDWEPEFLKVQESEDEEDKVSSAPTAFGVNNANTESIFLATTSGLAFSKAIVSQLHFGLWSHPRRHFAILAGLSGSGKTLLAKRYAHALVSEFSHSPESNVFIQAVQPGWYDASPLFGYINPLSPDNYMRSPLLDFILKAASHPDQPYIVILDEMNLSHPEQYFAPVLSAMESGESLRFHNEADSFDGVPKAIPYPSNIAIIGTVNMDETTHGISDKVLDRAFTLEFWDISLESYPRWEGFGLNGEELDVVKACLGGLLAALAPERLHFGWRTVEDVLSYLSLARQAAGFSFVDSLDDVIYARILPKLRGTESERLRMAMDETIRILDKHSLERSVKKVESLKADLVDIGMMRFWR